MGSGGSAGPHHTAPQQSIPSTAPSRPYIEGDSQGQQPGREDTEDPIEIVEEASVQPAVGVGPDEVAPLGAVVLPNLPALRGTGEGAWPGPPSTHRPPEGCHGHPEGTLPPQGLLSAGRCHTRLSFPTCATRAWVEGCARASRGGSPCPHTHPRPWEGAGLASSEVFGGENQQRRKSC